MDGSSTPPASPTPVCKRLRRETPRLFADDFLLRGISCVLPEDSILRVMKFATCVDDTDGRPVASWRCRWLYTHRQHCNCDTQFSLTSMQLLLLLLWIINWVQSLVPTSEPRREFAALNPKQTSRYCCATGACEVMRGVGHHSFDDQGRRFNGIDEACGFAKPELRCYRGHLP